MVKLLLAHNDIRQHHRCNQYTTRKSQCTTRPTPTSFTESHGRPCTGACGAGMGGRLVSGEIHGHVRTRPMKGPACSMTPNQVGLGPGQLCPRKMRLLLAAGSMGMLRPANDILAENDFSKDPLSCRTMSTTDESEIHCVFRRVESKVKCVGNHSRATRGVGEGGIVLYWWDPARGP